MFIIGKPFKKLVICVICCILFVCCCISAVVCLLLLKGFRGRMSYKIKQIPEDFIVREIKKPVLKQNGQYMICLLKKKDYTTQKAVEIISRFFYIKQKSIGYAGTKDRS